MVVGTPLESSFHGIGVQTSAAASVVASRTNWVSSTLGLKAWVGLVGGTLGPECYSGAEKSVHVDGCLALGLGYSRRREIVPSVELVGGIGSPWRLAYGRFESVECQSESWNLRLCAVDIKCVDGILLQDPLIDIPKLF
jgi:hypothetical protein